MTDYKAFHKYQLKFLTAMARVKIIHTAKVKTKVPLKWLAKVSYQTSNKVKTIQKAFTAVNY